RSVLAGPIGEREIHQTKLSQLRRRLRARNRAVAELPRSPEVEHLERGQEPQHVERGLGDRSALAEMELADRVLVRNLVDRVDDAEIVDRALRQIDDHKSSINGISIAALARSASNHDAKSAE